MTLAVYQLKVATPTLGATMPKGNARSSFRAFSLVELLVVISILGLLAGIAVPALKDMGKSNVQVSAARQLLDDVGRARQLAMSQHTTVYMVFVPTNFWNNPTWLNNLTHNQLITYTNQIARQLTGYAFLSYGRLGDQPGQHSWHYLSSWQALPDGSFINRYKYITYQSPVLPVLDIPQWNIDHPHPDHNVITNLTYKLFPFPTEDPGINLSPSYLSLPYIAFNYLGQLSVDSQTAASRDEYLPLAQGIVGYGTAINNKTPVPTIVQPNDILERPPGNSTNIGYNIVHIDKLTGRATLEFFKIQ